MNYKIATVKMSILHKLIYRFNAIPMRIPNIFSLCRNNKIYPKVQIDTQGALKSETVLKNSVRLTLWSFKSWGVTVSGQHNTRRRTRGAE